MHATGDDKYNEHIILAITPKHTYTHTNTHMSLETQPNVLESYRGWLRQLSAEDIWSVWKRGERSEEEGWRERVRQREWATHAHVTLVSGRALLPTAAIHFHALKISRIDRCINTKRGGAKGTSLKGRYQKALVSTSGQVKNVWVTWQCASAYPHGQLGSAPMYSLAGIPTNVLHS